MFLPVELLCEMVLTLLLLKQESVLFLHTIEISDDFKRNISNSIIISCAHTCVFLLDKNAIPYKINENLAE
jgi:hypothetical protein